MRLCREKYGDKFEYPNLPEFVTRSVISIICKIHGKFEMIARDHHRTKHGCPHCANESRQTPIEVSNQRWVEKASLKFSNKFDYGKVNLKALRGEKVVVTCPLHGSFETKLKDHFHSEAGCPECGRALNLLNRTKYKTLEDAVAASRKVHGDKFTYHTFCPNSKVITFACPLHGAMEQLIFSHLTGRGCQRCGYLDRTMTADEFVSRAKAAHPTGYSYNLSELRTVNDKITITHECGKVYRGRVSNHLNGQGCFSCKSSLGEAKVRKFLELNEIEYIEQFKIDNYPYRFDFYIPVIKVLIEYDGAQHFRPIEHFGGMAAFLKTRERDQEKNTIAKLLGFRLIRISYKWFDNLEVYLSRTIDKYFNYRVDGVFYRNISSLCSALGLSQRTDSRDLEHCRTFRALQPAQSEMIG